MPLYRMFDDVGLSYTRAEQSVSACLADPTTAEDLGVDSLTFLSNASLDSTFPGSRCAACFDGVYPLAVPCGRTLDSLGILPT